MIGALPAEVFRDLPAGDNVFALIETTQPEVVLDRFAGGGLLAGGAARAGAFLTSWSQTQYRVGSADISSPVDGAPLLFPETGWWDRIGIDIGPAPPGLTAPGLIVSMRPRGAAARWSGAFEGLASGGGLVADSSAPAPPIARLRRRGHGGGFVSGPVSDRTALTFGGAWSASSTFERGATASVEQHVGSGFAQVEDRSPSGGEFGALAWVQSIRVPFALARHYGQPGASTSHRAIHVQSTFERRQPGTTGWRLAGNYTRRSRRDEVGHVAGFAADRLVDGPIPALIDGGDGAEQRWAIDAAVAPRWRPGPHTFGFAAGVEAIGATAARPFSGVVAEYVDGRQARVWRYSSPGRESSRRATLVRAMAHDRLAWSSGVTLDATLRFESTDGGAGGAEGVHWRSWLPSARLRWDIGTPLGLAFAIGGGRTAVPLRLGLLAYGDPSAPYGEVFQFPDPPPERQTPIARVGPGTGGDPSFSAIDPHLAPPLVDEFAIRLEAQPRPSLRLGVAGLARRESSLINVVNTGVPASGYTTFTIQDPNADLIGPADDQLLTVYNRRPETFGQDRYLLTNPEAEAATMAGVVVSAGISTDRLFMWIGGTASMATGSGANRGFRAVENDQDAIGELHTNPNAATYARGRLFTDRAYTIKWTSVVRFGYDIRLGVIARYQDGQPFSRMVVVPALNQGPEAIQAFANGRSRFAFTGTVDVRLQKGFAAGRTRLDAILDAYNLLNLSREVEEYVVTGPRFRETTAIQPPRAIHLGARLAF